MGGWEGGRLSREWIHTHTHTHTQLIDNVAKQKLTHCIPTKYNKNLSMVNIYPHSHMLLE